MKRKERWALNESCGSAHEQSAVTFFILGFDKARAVCAEAVEPFTVSTLDESLSEMLRQLGEEDV